MSDIHPTATISPYARLYTTRLVVGAYSRIDDGVILTGDVEIGAYTHIACYCTLHGKSNIKIGFGVGIGANCTFLSESDDFHGDGIGNPCVHEEYRWITRGAIFIGDGSVIGVRCTFLPGANLDEDVSIGAHSLVKGRYESTGIYAGTPTRRVGTRKSGTMEKVRELQAAQHRV